MKGNLIGQGRTAEIYEWGEGNILKLFRPDFPFKVVEWEAQAGKVAFEAGLPAPRVEDCLELEGRAAIIYERITGPSMLNVLSRKPWLVYRTAHLFAGLHAEMHNRQSEELPAQPAILQQQIEQAPGLSGPLKQAVLNLLQTMSTGNSLCHGDFHPDNIMLSARGPVIIDWMTTHQGNPLFDVARTAYMLQKGAIQPGTGRLTRVILGLFRQLFYLSYLRAYRQIRPFSKGELAKWRVIMAAARLNEGIEEEQEQLLSIIRDWFAKAPYRE